MFVLEIIIIVILVQIAGFMIKYAFTNIIEFLAKNIDSSLKTENYSEDVKRWK